MEHRPIGPSGRFVLRATSILAVFAAFAPAIQAAADPKASRYYEDALIRYEKKDLPGAIIQLKNSLQIDKNQLPVQMLLGKALLANGEVAAAEVAFNEALRLGVNRSEVVVPLAESYAAQGKQRQLLSEPLFADNGLPTRTRMQLLLLKASAHSDLGSSRNALAAIEDAKSIGSGAAEPHIAEAPIRIRARQLKEAREAVDRALAIAPNSAEAWYQKGAVLHVGGALKEALSAYEKSLQFLPGHIEARVARIGLLIDYGRDADARKDLAELRGIAPNEPRGAYLRALLAEKEKRSAEAVAALNEVTALIDPVPFEYIRYRPQLLMLNGLAHFGLNQLAKAKPYLEGFHSATGASPVSRLLAQVYLQDREPAKAISVLEEYLRAQPQDAKAMNLLAAAHMAEGRHNKATTLMQEALQIKDAPESRTTLGLSLIGGGKTDDALAHLEKAFKSDPTQTQAGTALIGLYLGAGQAAKAVAVAEAMVKRQPDHAAWHNLLGLAQVELRNFQAGRTAFEKALSLDASLLPARLNLVRLDIETRALESATTRLTVLLKEQDRNPEVAFEMASLAYRKGDAAESQRWLEKTADLEGPKQTRALLALVEMHLRFGRATPALEAAKRAYAKTPEDLNVLLALASAHLASGDAGSARSTLTTANRLAEYKPRELVNIADMQLLANDVPGAAYSLDKALSTAPDDLPAQALMTQIELRQGDPAKAEKRARAIIARHPKLAVGHRLLGDTAIARKQSGPAIDAYRKAHQVEPSTATVLRLFGVLAEQDGGKASQALAEQWLKSRPADIAVRRALADHLARRGNLPAAKAAYEALVKVAPNDAGALNNLANVLFRLKDPGAVKIAEQALAKSPGNALVIDTLGWILFKSGDTDRALQYLRDARLREPGNPEIRYHLGAVLAKVGRKAEAREELEVAVKSGHRFEGENEAAALLRDLP